MLYSGLVLLLCAIKKRHTEKVKRTQELGIRIKKDTKVR